MGNTEHPKPSYAKFSPWLTLLFVSLLFADLHHAGSQYYATPLDGDMPPGILITWDVQKIFDDPLGFDVVRRGYEHANPNRFFCHWAFARYFQVAPLLLQHFVDPLPSVYLACMLIKLLIHAGLVLLLALFVRCRTGGGWSALVLLALLAAPLMQIEGYRLSIGIIDQSLTYTFFYALPALGFLLLLWCFHLLLNNPPAHALRMALLYFFTLGLSLVLPLSGPLVAPCVLIGALVLFLRNVRLHGLAGWLQRIRMKRAAHGILLFLVVASAYSLWLGTYNTIEAENVPPLNELYSRLPNGLYDILTAKPAIPILLSFIVLNMIILHAIRYSGVRPLRSDMGWFLLFITLYVVLLPMGGYRPWRESSIRFDTMIPFTLGLFYFYLTTSWQVIQRVQRKKWLYGLALGAMLFHFSLTDLTLLNTNECEARAIEKIAGSTEETVVLTEDCPILSWHVITDPERSTLQGELLWQWRITDRPKRFYFRDQR